MSVDTTFDGEKDRHIEALEAVDPRLVPFFVDLSEVFEDSQAGRVLSFSSEQLDGLETRLDMFAAVVRAERERRVRTDSMSELFGEDETEAALSAAVVSMETHRHIHPVIISEDEEAEAAELPATREVPAAATDETTDEATPEDAPEPASEEADEPEAATEAHAHEAAPTEPAAVQVSLERQPGEHDATYSIRLTIAEHAPGTILQTSDFYTGTLLGQGRKKTAAQQMFRMYVGPFVKSGQLIRIGEGAGTRYKIGDVSRAGEQVVDGVSTPQAAATLALAKTVHVDESRNPKRAPDRHVKERTLSEEVTVSLSAKGLDVQRSKDGTMKVLLKGEELQGLDEFGNLPAFVLLGMALRVYSLDVTAEDLAMQAERLGYSADKGMVTNLLNKLQGRIITESTQLIKRRASGGKESWAVAHAITPTAEQCAEILENLGFSTVQARRFLA